MRILTVKNLSRKAGSVLAGVLGLGAFMFLMLWFYSALAVSPVVGLVDWYGGFWFALETLDIR